MAKTFEQYVKHLNKMLRENKELKNLPVFYSVDDEGNDYQPVVFDATFGVLKHGDLQGVYCNEENKDKDIKRSDLNVVVIN